MLLVDDHVVAQIVKAKLVVGTVSNVGIVCHMLFTGQLSVHDKSRGKSEKLVHATHFLAVAARQIVVDGDDVHALARQRVEVRRHGGNQRLTFTGFHLGDSALMQNDAAEQLHIKGALAEHAPVCLANDGKCVGQDVVERFSAGESLFECCGLCAQLLVGHSGVFRRKCLNLICDYFQFLDLMVAVGAENFCDKSHSV